jgi:hypothetical protein
MNNGKKKKINVIKNKMVEKLNFLRNSIRLRSFAKQTVGPIIWTIRFNF